MRGWRGREPRQREHILHRMQAKNPVLRIHWNFLLRIRIRGSMPLTKMDPDPAIIVSDLEDVDKKLLFLLSVIEVKQRCCGSASFWCRSGSDFLFSVDPDPESDPSLSLVHFDNKENLDRYSGGKTRGREHIQHRMQAKNPVLRISMKFWYGSGSADLYLWLMDPDPAIFASDLQDVNNFFF